MTNTKDLKDDYDVLKEKSNAYELALNSNGSLTDEQKEKVKRLEFLEKTKRVLAQRVGYRCSCPECTNITIGPGDSPTSVVILGEAAHIVGAVQQTDGLSPRADASMSEDEIRDLANGIWLCRHHHKLVDSKTSTYKVSQLKERKKQAEEKQAKLMEQKEPAFVEDYIFPKIHVDKGIDTDKFRESEWCLLAYLIDNDFIGNRKAYSDFEGYEGSNFFSEYENWMSENSIDPTTAKINFKSYYPDIMRDIREIANKLTGVVKMNDAGLYHGKIYDDFVEKLFEDNDALIKIKSKLSKI